jgi:hypothetical protein
MDSSKDKKAEEFLAFARHVGKWPTTALAAAEMPAVSSDATRVAELLVGGLGLSEPVRVARMAARLDKLVVLDRAERAKKPSHGEG